MTMRAARVIQAVVCDHFGFDRDELLGERRWQCLCLARHLAMYLCRERLGLSYPEIGHAFADRDHTTVMSACQRIRDGIERDRTMQNHLATLLTTLDELSPQRIAAE